jgi:hypothetical protein
MRRRILTIATTALLALPLGASTALAASPECDPKTYDSCTRPIWCDGTGYSCHATGFAQWLADRVLPA